MRADVDVASLSKKEKIIRLGTASVLVRMMLSLLSSVGRFVCDA